MLACLLASSLARLLRIIRSRSRSRVIAMFNTTPMGAPLPACCHGGYNQEKEVGPSIHPFSTSQLQHIFVTNKIRPAQLVGFQALSSRKKAFGVCCSLGLSRDRSLSLASIQGLFVDIPIWKLLQWQKMKSFLIPFVLTHIIPAHVPTRTYLGTTKLGNFLS